MGGDEMTDKKLARAVTVGGVTYGPDDDIPADVAKQIRNPKAWVPVEEQDADRQQNLSGRPGTASGHVLASTVTVAGTTYGPDDFIPDAVAKQIRNPKAWRDGEVPPVAGGDDPAKNADGDSDKPSDDDDAKARKAAPAAKRV